jgi:hypothetical protein
VARRSLVSQTLHYFARPHEAILRRPHAGPAAWKGAELAKRTDWKTALSADEVAELDAALACAKRTGKPTGALGRRDFPLPTLARRIAAWREEIQNGRGFQVVTGVPVERWGRADSERFFWCFGLHLGEPGAQNPNGDLLGQVTDTGAEAGDPNERLYKTSARIDYHCDAADVVGLLCLAKARKGGQSRIVSSVSIYDELLARRPDLVDRLYEPFLLDTRGEGGLRYFPIAPCRYFGGKLRTFYHADYFRSAQGYDEVPRFSERDRALLDLYDEIAADPALYLDMDLEPGFIQLVSNHTVLHARTDYEDWPEPEKKRHLLRLWISLPAKRDARTRIATARSKASLVAAMLASRVQQRRRR